MKKFDVVIIGGGSGGCAAASRLADLGKKVALIEMRGKEGLGGTCINRGCIPAKILLAAAEAYSGVLKARDFGIEATGVSFDYRQVIQKKQGTVKALKFGLQNFVLKPRGIEIFYGLGRIRDPHTVEVTGGDQTELLQAENIIIATGSEPAMFSSFNIDGQNVLTSDHALDLQEIPPELLIIGAGALGLEFAHLFSTFGSKVSIVEMAPQIIPALADQEFTGLVQNYFEKQGIAIKTGVKIESVELAAAGKVVSSLSNGEKIESSKVLVAIGRKLNTTDLGLQEAGIKMERDRIVVDESMRTSIPNIYAVGDIVPGPQLSHKAQREGIVAAEAIAGLGARMDNRVIPWAIFTQPEIAAVGMTREEAERAQIKTITGSLPLMANEKANTMKKTAGLVKVVARADNLKLIGAQVFATEASVLIGELALAIANGVTVESLSNTVHVHPSLSEAIMEACKGSLGKAFHRSAR